MASSLESSGHRTVRRPRLTDVAILIAATAIGLAAVRHFLPTGYSPSPYDRQFNYLSPPAALSWLIVSQPLLMAWSVACLVMQLRPPRPRLRRLVHLPGFRACLAATLLIFIAGPWVSGFLLSSSGTVDRMSFLAFLSWNEAVAVQIGVGVIVAWAPCLLGGGRRGRMGWLERGGRFLGVLWILLIPANLIRLVWYNLGM